VAKDKTKKRLRKLEKRRRKELRSRPLGPDRGQGPNDPLPPGDDWDYPSWDQGSGDDLEGGAGVREPRRPWPTTPAAALELEEPQPQYLDLTRR
jgi:hypothetical protein